MRYNFWNTVAGICCGIILVFFVTVLVIGLVCL